MSRGDIQNCSFNIRFNALLYAASIGQKDVTFIDNISVLFYVTLINNLQIYKNNSFVSSVLLDSFVNLPRLIPLFFFSSLSAKSSESKISFKEILVC